MTAPPDLVVAADVAAEAAGRIAAALRESIANEGRATLALSGGSTPGPVYRRLADEPDVDWANVHVFWVDERCVTADDEWSNERLARETLLDHVPIPGEQVYPMACAADPDAAAEAYDAGLKQFFGGQRAAFTVAVLGVGEDGHVASLFPGVSPPEPGRWAVHTQAPPPHPVPDRLSLTLHALDGAHLALFVATGAKKRDVLARVFADYDREPADALPAAAVRPTEGKVVWVVDEAARPNNGTA